MQNKTQIKPEQNETTTTKTTTNNKNQKKKPESCNTCLLLFSVE